MQTICAVTNKEKGTHFGELALCLHLYSGVCESTLAFVNQSRPLRPRVPDQHLEGTTKSSGALDALQVPRAAHPSGGRILSNPRLVAVGSVWFKGLQTGPMEDLEEHEAVTRRKDHFGLTSHSTLCHFWV